MFLDKESAIQDLRCWEEIEKFYSLPYAEKGEATARQVEKQFLHKNYLFNSQYPTKRELQLKVWYLNNLAMYNTSYAFLLLLLQI